MPNYSYNININVLDYANKAIKIFSKQGNFIKQIKINVMSPAAGFLPLRKNILIGSYDLYNNTMVQIFDRSGNQIHSYGNPITCFESKKQILNILINKIISSAHIIKIQKNIFVATINPHIIYQFNISGDLNKIFLFIDSNIKTLNFKRIAKNKYQFGSFSRTTLLAYNGNYIMLSIFDPENSYAILKILNKLGILLHVKLLKTRFIPIYNKDMELYGIEEKQNQKIVIAKYLLYINKNKKNLKDKEV